jgi:hypothetical protein
MGLSGSVTEAGARSGDNGDGKLLDKVAPAAREAAVRARFRTASAVAALDLPTESPTKSPTEDRTLTRVCPIARAVSKLDTVNPSFTLTEAAAGQAQSTQSNQYVYFIQLESIVLGPCSSLVSDSSV